ncbi:MAG TPA: AraC family transcriptional regulator [Bacteroidia bacterium]|jgi:AraC-like DNA-binding protein|nr:AraC family transcriptional regulator [Bacteroidia bacterium]
MPKQQTVLNLKQFKGSKHAEPDFYIRTFQEHKTEHPFVMKPHAHDFYLVMLFTKGQGKHIIDFKEYTVKRGAAFFMSPSETHAWELSDDTNGYVLFFNPAFFLMDVLPRQIKHLPFFNPEHKMNYGQLKKEDVEVAETLLQQIYYENNEVSSFKKNILRSYLDILLYKLADLLQTKNTNEGELNLIPALLSLVEEHYITHQPISFYASKLKVSAQKLNADCKLQLSKTVNILLQDRLLTEAKRLLAYSALTISEIAYQLNFNDNSYFNRFFKRMEGITPEQFRHQRKSTINT